MLINRARTVCVIKDFVFIQFSASYKGTVSRQPGGVVDDINCEKV